MASQMKTVAVYYRVSTDLQELTSQKFEIERWLNELKQKPNVLYFEDYAKSGKRNDRPGFVKMMKAAHAKKFDTIVVYRLDRFSRDASTAIRLITELDEYGIGFVSVTQPILDLRNDMPLKRTILSLFAELAEMERDAIVVRVKSGMAAAKKRGVKLGAPKRIDEKKVFEVRALRDEGLTFKEIAARAGISVGSVHKALLNARSSNDNNELCDKSA